MFVELQVLGYAMFMAFLLAVWMETDGLAVRASEIDWWTEAAKRLFLIGDAVAIFAAILLPLNKLLFRWLGLKNRRFAIFSASTAFC